jgi:hypothetical protein
VQWLELDGIILSGANNNLPSSYKHHPGSKAAPSGVGFSVLSNSSNLIPTHNHNTCRNP